LIEILGADPERRNKRESMVTTRTKRTDILVDITAFAAAGDAERATMLRTVYAVSDEELRAHAARPTKRRKRGFGSGFRWARWPVGARNSVHLYAAC